MSTDYASYRVHLDAILSGTSQSHTLAKVCWKRMDESKANESFVAIAHLSQGGLQGTFSGETPKIELDSGLKEYASLTF